MKPRETLLLEGARCFDPETLAEIYDCHSPGVYRYAMRLLGDDIQAEECVADTFHRFLVALHNGGGPRDHLQAYLYQIAHNWITDRYRRDPQLFALDEETRGNDPDVICQVDEHIEQNRIREALRLLTPDQRQVVILKYLEGWENEAVAKVLNKPIGAIKSLQHRAVEALKRQLIPREEKPHDVSE